jgi:hypothetical protein
MRFYQLTYALAAPGQVPVRGQEWFPSERDAVVRRLALFNSGKLVGKKSDHEIWPVDIPTDKVGLLRWLRENVQ